MSDRNRAPTPQSLGIQARADSNSYLTPVQRRRLQRKVGLSIAKAKRGAAAASILRRAAEATRETLPNASGLLLHFLDGSGSPVTIPKDEARSREPVQTGERINQERFKEGFLKDRSSYSLFGGEPEPEYEYRKHLLAMKDGETIQVPKNLPDPGEPIDRYDHIRKGYGSLLRGNLDEALASGDTQFSSKTYKGFTAKREENRIIMTGIVTHEWEDDYDFHREEVSSAVAETARDHGGAKEFKVQSSWNQRVTAEFIVVNGDLVLRSIDWTDVD